MKKSIRGLLIAFAIICAAFIAWPNQAEAAANNFVVHGQESYVISGTAGQRLHIQAPQVTADDTSQITYKWSAYTLGNPPQVYYQNGPVFTNGSYAQIANAYLEISDGYGNTANIYYQINADNGFAFAGASEDEKYSKDEYYLITPDMVSTPITFYPASVVGNDISHVTYDWAWAGNDKVVHNASGPSLTLMPTDFTEVMLTIEDGYGTKLTQFWYGLMVNYDQGNGAVNGLACMNDSWVYLRNGQIDWEYTGLVCDPNLGWWYVQNGAVNFGYTGLVANDYGWWYVQNGTINFAYTGLAYDQYVGWWYVQNGAIDFSRTGLVYDQYVGWWYVQNGAVDFSRTGLVYDPYVGWWYVENGAINFNYNGLAYDPYVGWWVVNNGAINFGYTGMIANEYGWWYAVNGALDLGATGWACNDYGWWLYYNGTIAFNYTGWWGDYYCVNGHLA